MSKYKIMIKLNNIKNTTACKVLNEFNEQFYIRNAEYVVCASNDGKILKSIKNPDNDFQRTYEVDPDNIIIELSLMEEQSINGPCSKYIKGYALVYTVYNAHIRSMLDYRIGKTFTSVEPREKDSHVRVLKQALEKVENYLNG